MPDFPADDLNGQAGLDDFPDDLVDDRWDDEVSELTEEQLRYMASRVKKEKEMPLKAHIPLDAVEASTWRTENGTVLPINGMDDNHLLNCLHLLERRRLETLQRIQKRYEEVPFADTERYAQLMEYYSEFPRKYYDILSEAQERGLVLRLDKDSYVTMPVDDFNKLVDEKVSEALKKQAAVLTLDFAKTLDFERMKNNAAKKSHAQAPKKAARKAKRRK